MLFSRLWLRFALVALLWFLPGSKLMATSYTLTTQTNGSGVVTLNPTNGTYPANSVVTATAVPSYGWYFSGWSGGASGTNDPINVPMTNNLTITANFLAIPTYVLITSTNGMGSVSLNPPGGAYLSNTVVTATALPSGGWYFSGWSNGASGTNNPINVPMTSNITITANFLAFPTYVLTASTNGMGSVSLNPPNGAYISNSVVSATASPAAGWVFANWSGYTNGNANPLAITMNSNEAVTAVFAEPATIVQGPQNASIAVGGTVNFNVQAAGTPTLFYQWGNGLMLANATNATLTLSNVQSAQAGTYSIVVSNAYGVSSNAAVLRITNAPSGTNVVSVATEAALQSAIDIGGVVTFGFNGTITLTNTINITNNVTVDATGRTVVISGDNAVGLFNVSPGVTFSATNLVMVNGSAVGQSGVTEAYGAAENGSPGQGGAILNNGGTVELIDCTLASNSVTGGRGGSGGPGGNYLNGIGGDGQGGAIFVNGGSLLLQSVNLYANSATGGQSEGISGSGRGGAIYITNGSVLIANCNVSSNASLGPISSAAFGGALFLASGSVAFSNSIISSNTAFGASGFPYVGYAPAPAYGGAIAATSGTAIITMCQVVSNVAQSGQSGGYNGTVQAEGGGVFSSATVLVSNSTFSGNQALSGGVATNSPDGGGGAFYNSGSAIMVGCTISSNIAVGGSAGPEPAGNGIGGGIFNISQLTMTNCTLALNSAEGGSSPAQSGYDGAYAGSGIGGGVCNSNGMFSAMNVTIASNSVMAGQGGSPSLAIGANVANLAGTLALENSIIAYPETSSNASGTITDAGYNMSSDGSANFESGASFNFTDPLLLPLANNGGSTWTMALSSNSPAVGTGTALGAPSTDQRGFPRPSGSGVDMGAYQLQLSVVQIPAITFNNVQQVLELSFQGQSNATYVLQSSSTLTNWAAIETIGPLTNNAHVNLTIQNNGQSNAFFRLLLP